MKAELLIDEPMVPGALGVDTKAFQPYRADKRFVVAPRGTVLTGPDVWKLVVVGSCKPADEECWKACGMTKEQVLKQFRSYSRLKRAQVTGDPKFDAPDA